MYSPENAQKTWARAGVSPDQVERWHREPVFSRWDRAGFLANPVFSPLRSSIRVLPLASLEENSQGSSPHLPLLHCFSRSLQEAGSPSLCSDRSGTEGVALCCKTVATLRSLSLLGSCS